VGEAQLDLLELANMYAGIDNDRVYAALLADQAVIRRFARVAAQALL